MPKTKSSYTDLVHQAVRDSPDPLPFEEIMRRVAKIQCITTRNPNGTIRNAIKQSRVLAKSPIRLRIVHGRPGIPERDSS